MHRLVFLVLPLGLAASLSAQPPGGRPRGPGGPGGPGRGGHPIVRAIDADKNGEISATELAGAPAAILALDANKDGKVTVDELRPPRPADAPERPANAPERPADAPPRPADPVMLALDANADGELSASEIANASTSLKALDLNADGKLTMDEFRPLPPEGAKHDGPPPRRG